jgi:small subunit ribosomal protein S4
MSLRAKVQEAERVAEAFAGTAGRNASLVEVSIEKGEGVFKKVPDRDEFAADVNESLIVELYSR